MSSSKFCSISCSAIEESIVCWKFVGYDGEYPLLLPPKITQINLLQFHHSLDICHEYQFPYNEKYH